LSDPWSGCASCAAARSSASPPCWKWSAGACCGASPRRAARSALAPDQRLARPFEELRDTLLATIFGQATALQRAGLAAYLTIDEAGGWGVQAASAGSSAGVRSLTVPIPDPATPDREGELAARFYQALYGQAAAGDGGPRLREPDAAGDGEDGDGLAVRDALDRQDPALDSAEVDAVMVPDDEADAGDH
jgi:hypothetical protein